MAEAIAVIGLLASCSQLIEYGGAVVKRLHDFMTNVKELPPCFAHINNQLPMLMGIVDSLQKRAGNGDFTSKIQHDLERVIEALDKELKGLDAVLSNILPSARASTWEKGVKAVKSVAAQKRVENFAQVIQNYMISLNAFQLERLITSLEEQRLEHQSILPTPARKPIWMLEHDSDEDFVGREEILRIIEQQFATTVNRVVLAGIGGVGYGDYSTTRFDIL